MEYNKIRVTSLNFNTFNVIFNLDSDKKKKFFFGVK